LRVRVSFERPARVSPRILVQDLVAFWRHFRARLRVVAGDPVALGVLVSLGVAAVFLWVGAEGVLVRDPDLGVFLTVLAALVCAPLAAFAASGAALGLRAAGPGAMPALPLGSRTRAAADALLALVVMAATRAAAAGLLYVSSDPGAAALRASRVPLLFLTGSVPGVLLMLPVVLAWTLRPRLDARAFVAGLIVGLVVSCATLQLPPPGQTARLGVIASFSGALCLFVLLTAGLRVDVSWKTPVDPRPAVPSPGARAQLRRERTRGALTRLAPLVVVVLVVPPLLHGDPALLVEPWTGTWLTGLQVLALVTLPLFPMGLPLTGGSDRSFWAGSFARAWSALPLPPESVLRSVWGHAMVTGLAVWGFFAAWIRHFGGLNRDGEALVAIALASVPVLAGVVVCVAAGESRRGALAIAALLAILSLVPVMPLDWGIELLSTADRRLRFTLVAAAALAALGGLPPLTLLRRSRRRAGGR